QASRFTRTLTFTLPSSGGPYYVKAQATWEAPSSWWSRSRRADVTARGHAPAALPARSRGASPARPSRPPILRVLPGRRAMRAGTGRDLASVGRPRFLSHSGCAGTLTGTVNLVELAE